MDKEQTTSNSLLDVTKFSGEASGRMAPTLMFIALAGVPIMAYLYFLLGVVPIWVALIAYVPYAVRVGLITIGDEGTRLNQFKRQLYDVFSSTTEVMDVKQVHEDGMIEYTNGNIAYLIMLYNRDQANQAQRALGISNILRSFQNYLFDIRIYNMEMEDELYRRYEGVKFFSDDVDAAADFLKIIDYNREYARNNSLVSVTVLNVYGRLNECLTLKEICNSVTKSSESKLFRRVEVAKKSDVYKFLSEDMDTFVDIEEMQIQKYSDGEYYGSKVLGYDVVKETKEKVEVDFMEGGFLVE